MPYLRVAWSAGKGNWAKVPWITLLNERETQATQRGVYCVYLFREDMSGVYLTCTQGVTEPINPGPLMLAKLQAILAEES